MPPTQRVPAPAPAPAPVPVPAPASAPPPASASPSGSAPAAVRLAARRGELTGPTAGLAPGYVQANLVAVPRAQAYDFLLFCQRNPRPCPLLEVTEPGSAVPAALAPDADLRHDIPRYRVYRDGELALETPDAEADWRPDLVAFLLGCSFTFETALLRAGIPLRHIAEGRNVAMYVTDRPCRPAGAFAGPLVVSMRPIPKRLLVRAIQVTSRYPQAHGAPVHVGDPAAIGIADLARPDYGEAVALAPDEVPVFWACGVTPQAVAVRARPPLLVAHAPGHMFVTDLPEEELALR